MSEASGAICRYSTNLFIELVYCTLSFPRVIQKDYKKNDESLLPEYLHHMLEYIMYDRAFGASCKSDTVNHYCRCT